jgi:glucose-1-phosphate adenylyltransferase
MIGKNVLGLVFANVDDANLPDVTGIRSMASVPFGGGYRLVDFTLSNMVNAGITKVGVLTDNNYQSLMDHIGAGKPWDLARKNDGLYLLPPFNAAAASNYNAGEISALGNVLRFLERSNEEYVFMSACSYVANLDLTKIFAFHEAENADITLLSAEGRVPSFTDQPVIEACEGTRITRVRLGASGEGDAPYLLKAMLIKKALLIQLVREARFKGENSFEKDILLKHIGRLRICAYRAPGWCAAIDSLESYFRANFDLLIKENFTSLFPAERPVYTKTYEDMPAVYSLNADVRNSLIADGCIIEGEVENSILFRGCRIEKNAVVKNSILMPGCFVGDSAMLSFVIADKGVGVRPRKTLSGADSYPIYIAKEIQI